MRSALVVGTGLALSVGVFLGWTTKRATRSWADWQGAKKAVPPARRAAYGNARNAAGNWLLVLVIVIIVIAIGAALSPGDGD